MSSSSAPKFLIQSQKVAYKRYIQVLDRLVEFPDGRKIAWDVAGHDVPANPAYSVVFPFFTADSTTTLVKEYAQGPNVMVYTFPAGLYDRKKHSTVRECAAAELSEEARLTGGEWIPLMPEDSEGISELKWCTNRFVPFLVIDPVKDAAPGARDDEEFIRVHEHVPLARLKELILKGELMLPSVQTTFMALDKLRERGLELKGWT